MFTLYLKLSPQTFILERPALHDVWLPADFARQHDADFVLLSFKAKKDRVFSSRKRSTFPLLSSVFAHYLAPQLSLLFTLTCFDTVGPEGTPMRSLSLP